MSLSRKNTPENIKNTCTFLFSHSIFKTHGSLKLHALINTNHFIKCEGGLCDALLVIDFDVASLFGCPDG